MKIHVESEDNEQIVVEATTGSILMEVIRDEGLVEGTCGGAVSCGTCHIFVDKAWIDKVSPQTEDEGYMLESLEDVVEIMETSRLSCQIELDESHDGLSITIAPRI